MLLPFSFDPLATPYIHDESLGLDFAYIELSELYRRHLMVTETVPITKEDWTSRSQLQVASHWILGLPTQITRELNDTEEGSNAQSRSLAVVMVPIELLEVESELLALTTEFNVNAKFARFFGRITVEPDFDIYGMSGGPIFRVMIHPDGHYTYVAVALQSSWHRPIRVTAGCALNSFIHMIGSDFKELISWARS